MSTQLTPEINQPSVDGTQSTSRNCLPVRLINNDVRGSLKDKLLKMELDNNIIRAEWKKTCTEVSKKNLLIGELKNRIDILEAQMAEQNGFETFSEGDNSSLNCQLKQVKLCLEAERMKRKDIEMLLKTSNDEIAQIRANIRRSRIQTKLKRRNTLKTSKIDKNGLKMIGNVLNLSEEQCDLMANLINNTSGIKVFLSKKTRQRGLSHIPPETLVNVLDREIMNLKREKAHIIQSSSLVAQGTSSTKKLEDPLIDTDEETDSLEDEYMSLINIKNLKRKVCAEGTLEQVEFKSIEQNEKAIEMKRKKMEISQEMDKLIAEYERIEYEENFDKEPEKEVSTKYEQLMDETGQMSHVIKQELEEIDVEADQCLFFRR